MLRDAGRKGHVVVVNSMVEQPDEGAEPRERDALRARLGAMWTAVAPAWGEHADFVAARGAELTQRMLAATRPRPGERVLELACGAGDVGLAAAASVAPGGAVVLSDVAAEMTAVAAARSTARPVPGVHVHTRTLDLERIDEPTDSFDVVLCREGLMFALDPAQALREVRRVLRPGGRTALSVWGPRARNPWLAVVFDAVSAQRGVPIPPPGVPGPFSLGDAGDLATLVAGAGFVDASVTELAVPYRAASFEAWWARTAALAGPLSAILAGMPDDARRALRARLREAAAPYETAAGALDFPGLALIARGRA